MKAALLFNPIAGRRRRSVLEKALAALQARGINPAIHTTAKRGDACRIARDEAEQGTEIIIAGGGDGTINEVANALVGSPARLGILPLGLANLFALEMGIPRDPVAAAEVIACGYAQRISPGYAIYRNEGGGGERMTFFLLMAGIGFDGGVLREIRRSQIARWGKAAYVITGVRCLARYTRSRLTIYTERGDVIPASSAVVGKSRYYGSGRVMVTPRASLKDGFLDLCAFKDQGVLPMMRYACTVIMGSHLESAGIYFSKLHALEVRAAGTAYLQADGDYLGMLPARFGVKEDALSVMVPRSSAPSALL